MFRFLFINLNKVGRKNKEQKLIKNKNVIEKAQSKSRLFKMTSKVDNSL